MRIYEICYNGTKLKFSIQTAFELLEFNKKKVELEKA
jgi:hypothetical protein